MNVNGRDYVELSPGRAREVYARLAAQVAGSTDAVADVAYEVGRYVPPILDDKAIVRDLLDRAPETEGDERKALKKAARAALRKGRRDRMTVLVDPDELGRRALVDAEVAKLRIREEARELFAAERAAEGDEGGDDYADVAEAIANGVERRTPDAGGIRNDGARLSYSGAVNGLVGPPESGKTLVAIAQACDELKAGGRVLHIDADHNGLPATLAHYLAADGIEPDMLTDRERFRYVDVRSAEHVRAVVAHAAEWRPTIAVVDSIGELVPLLGGDSNSNDDYRRIHREVLTPLARAGAAVVALDHVTKEEGRGGYAIGAGAKKAAIDGSYLAVRVVEPFTPGHGGAAALKILKDRHGGLRAVSPIGKEPTAAVFRLDSRDAVTTWEFWKGRDESDVADEQAAADAAYVASLEPFPASRSALQAALRAAHGKGWANDRAHAALEAARRQRATTFPIDPSNDRQITKE